jgi:hypothetical protein
VLSGRRSLPLAILALVAGTARSQVQPAGAPDAMPMADYLGLLEQIAPAARQGAQAYLAAYSQRCGHALSTGELRAAMSRNGGDPTLMAMIRASQLQDAKLIAALAGNISCRGRK